MTTLPASAELQMLIDRAFESFLELSTADAPAAAFLLAQESLDQTLTRLPHGLGEVDRILQERGDIVDSYTAVATGDFPIEGRDVMAVVVEAEERDAGFAIRVARPFKMGDEGPEWNGEVIFLERTRNRLVGEATNVDEDQALLVVEALLCVMDADANRDVDEEDVLNDLLATIPLFDQDNIELIVDAAETQYRDVGGYPEALDHIERIQGVEPRRTCYALAAEMAWVAGAGKDEQEVLRNLGERLRIDDSLIDSCERTFKAKYGRDRVIDTNLMVRTLMAVIMADGAFDMAEMTAIELFVKLLPDFGGREAMPELADAHRELRAASDALTVLEGLQDLGDDEECATGLLVCAAEMAWASDGLDPREHRLIEDLSEELGLDEDVVEIANLAFEAKYNRSLR